MAQYREKQLQNGLSEEMIRREIVVLSHVFELATPNHKDQGHDCFTIPNIFLHPILLIPDLF